MVAKIVRRFGHSPRIIELEQRESKRITWFFDRNDRGDGEKKVETSPSPADISNVRGRGRFFPSIPPFFVSLFISGYMIFLRGKNPRHAIIDVEFPCLGPA